MCTISFIPKSNSDFILTSNRDESPGRETFAPKLYTEDGVKLAYPKDAVAGGTWIGVSENKRVVCLMNGGFIPHKRKPSYEKSRGVVVKDFLKATDIKNYVGEYDFSQIEPFTAVIIEYKNDLQLSTVVWDGEKLHSKIESLRPRIWSSSPLYPKELQAKRELWFSDFIKENPQTSPEKVLHFHKTGGEGNLNTDLIINRGFVRTKSITQIVKAAEQVEMHYEDLQKERVEVLRIEF